MKYKYNLQEVKLKKIIGENRIDQNIPFIPGTKMEYKIEVKSGLVNENPKIGLVIVGVYSKSDIESRFNIELEYLGVYESEDMIDQEELRQYSLEEGYFELWPYVRVSMMQLTQSLGIAAELSLRPPIIKK